MELYNIHKKKPPFTIANQAGHKVRGVGKRMTSTVSNVEDLDKFTKFASSVLKALDFFGLSRAFAPLKGLIKGLSEVSSTFGATNILSRIAECTSFYSPKGLSFYQTPNPKATVGGKTVKKDGKDVHVGGFDFKRVSRGFLFAAHILTTTHWVTNIAGLAKFTGHFVGKNAFRFIPGVALFMDSSVLVSGAFSLTATSLTIHRVNKGERKDKSGLHLYKWQARAKLFNALEKDNSSQIETLKKQFIQSRLKIQSENKDTKIQKQEKRKAAEQKWDRLVNKEIFDDIEKRKNVREIADRKVCLYRHKALAISNERHKSAIAIIADIAKLILVGLGITASILAALAVTPIFPLTPLFVTFGLIAGTTGIWKALLDRKCNADKDRLDKTVKEYNKAHNLINSYKVS